MAIWDDVLPERDREVYQEAGYGSRGGLGQRPAVLVVDMNAKYADVISLATATKLIGSLPERIFRTGHLSSGQPVSAAR